MGFLKSVLVASGCLAQLELNKSWWTAVRSAIVRENRGIGADPIVPIRLSLSSQWRALLSAAALRPPGAWHPRHALHPELALLPKADSPPAPRHDEKHPEGSLPPPWGGDRHGEDDPESPSYELDCRAMPGQPPVQTPRWSRAGTTRRLGTSSWYLHNQRSYAVPGTRKLSRNVDCLPTCTPLQ
jgi:hypothetical protein